MKKFATEIKEIVENIVGDDLQAFGYYTSEEHNVICLREDMKKEYTEERINEILKNAQLDTISQPTYESLHSEQLHATIRIFKEKADITITIEERSGVIFALDPKDKYSYQEIIDTIYETVDI